MSTTVNNSDSRFRGALEQLASELRSHFPDINASDRVLVDILNDALGTARFIDDLSELLRLPKGDVGEVLGGLGVAVARPSVSRSIETAGSASWAASPGGLRDTFDLRMEAFFPGFAEPFAVSHEVESKLNQEWDRLVSKVRGGDPFLSYYREGVAQYVAEYRAKVAPRIGRFVVEKFGESGPKYVVTVGIGANEQFWHYPQRWYEINRAGGPAWLICDNPKDIARLPRDASSRNTLFLEFSRSGKTQEIVKVHEFLPPDAFHVVFANEGPLHELAKDAGESRCLVCETDTRIPGRFGKNLTPMLLAPLDLLHLPIDEYWAHIDGCIRAWDLADPASPPAALARYLRAAQLVHGSNHIYLGTNDDVLLGSADEFVQFWNEGVNKQGNDYSVSRYFGLPRDSHLNIEGILGNCGTKTSLFLLRRDSDELFQHPLRNSSPSFYNKAHAGLTIADVDYALARANVDHFGTIMPTVSIEVDRATLPASAVLSQLWTDTVYCYAVMIGVNPGSNPEVRNVRDRSDSLLAGFGRSKAS